MIVGIDLGTTYCCVAYFDEAGQPRVVPGADGHSTTPSVVYFNGEEMCAGEPANRLKNQVPQHQIFDLFKPDMGKVDEHKRYVVNRQHYGPEGISALLLRTLKRDAIAHLQQAGHPEAGSLSMDKDLDAVITVPAYFRDKERRATMLAGYAAGLNVVHIINEPTAASLAHSLQNAHDRGVLSSEDKRILVFDLGGGTCDVTILEIRDAQVEVVATDGSDDLGGQNWDELIEEYLKRAFYGQNLIELSKQERFTLQACARQAKHELTDKGKTKAVLQTEAGEVEVVLHRTPPEGIKLTDTRRRLTTDAGTSGEATFYFERNAQDLLVRCKNLCLNVLEEAGRKKFSELGRSMEWADLDEIVMAGGSCRMPMIPKMLEEETGMRPRQVEKFGYDVAVAIGAAYHGTHEALNIDIVDVVPCDVGIEVLRDGQKRVRHLIRKNAPLPAATRRTFDADRNAHLTVYEGESQLPQECDRRGDIELDNPEGEVTVTLEVNEQGVLTATADYPPNGHRSVNIKNVLYDFDGRAEPLREKVQAIRPAC